MHTTDTKLEKLEFTKRNWELLTSFPDDGFMIVLPYLLDFLFSIETQIQSIELIIPIIDKLGTSKGRQIIGTKIAPLFELEKRHDLIHALIDCKLVFNLLERLGLSYVIDFIFPCLFRSLRCPDMVVSERGGRTIFQFGLANIIFFFSIIFFINFF